MSGVADIQFINGSGSTVDGVFSTTATPIVRTSEWSIVVATVTEGDETIQLPADAMIGDAVEVHCDGQLLFVNFPSGEGMTVDRGDAVDSNGVHQVGIIRGYIFRKLTASTWGMASGT
jgi:hypothetical protein